MIHDLYQKYLNSTGISTDTRNIRKGNIFFALKGPNYNANKFAGQALESGASYTVIDDPDEKIDARMLLVNDGLQTLQELARLHRSNLKIPVFGLTGSNGKTTTKELINAVLSQKYITHSTQGNLNNHIGVPLTILGMNVSTEIGIIEMGANKIREIRELCQISRPTHGLITNIGQAHIEGFGSLEGVLRGKSELYDWLLNQQGTVFYNSTDPVLSNMAKRFASPLSYPGENDYSHCSLEKKLPYISIKAENDMIIQTRLIGGYNFLNVAAALCVAKFFDVPFTACRQAIENYEPRNNRSQILKKDSNTLILDAYNANPSSMEAALNHLNELDSDNRIAILGDMFELGDYAEEGHRKIGEITKQMDLKLVIFCGEKMKHAFEKNRDARYFQTRNELEEFLKYFTFENSTILIKGSRAMALENIVEKLKSK
jgi:UDP-N-acetylmuramoyl-tripeptide--D-alanyl-D-alanine ligase